MVIVLFIVLWLFFGVLGFILLMRGGEKIIGTPCPADARFHLMIYIIFGPSLFVAVIIALTIFWFSEGKHQ